MKKLLFFFVIYFLLSLSCYSQQAIAIGQRMPDVILNSILFYEKSSAPLRSFQKKLLILDFWGTGCSACITAFPKLDSLQKQFGSMLQIVAVNKETQDSTLRFFKKRPFIKLPSLPFVTGDTVLRRFFPHVYMPHHVWIDSNGIVCFITDGHNATEANIQAFLSGHQLKLSEKKYEENYFYDKLIQALSQERFDDQVASYSLLMHYIPGISFSSSARSSVEGGQPNYLTRQSSVTGLFCYAFNEGGQEKFSERNVILKVQDPYPYQDPKVSANRDQWLEKHFYSYELRVPIEKSHLLYLEMRKDLERYFPLRGRVEKMMRTCLVLRQIGPDSLLRSKTLKKSSNMGNPDLDIDKFSLGYPMDNLVAFIKKLCLHISKLDFVCEIMYEGPADMRFPAELFQMPSLPLLKKSLIPYGLEIIEVRRLRDVLVLEEQY